MPTAYFNNSADKRIGTGTYTYSFNPSGDVTGAEVEDVRFNFKLDYNNGAEVDLDKIQIWLRAPDGDQDRIYYNFPNALAWVNDNDDNNDSDSANDWDIDFFGTGSKATTDDLKGAKVTGTWKLIIENDTGKTLDLDGLEVAVTYKKPEDYTITDLKLIGSGQVGEPMQIQATIKNVGQLYKFEQVVIEYLVDGVVIGTSTLLAGLGVGSENIETELYTFTNPGATTVEARIKGSPDTITSNNSLSKTFIIDHNDPDLAVTDIRVTGNGEAGSTHFIAADVTNVGNATHYGDIELQYLVNGELVGTQTIGGAGVNIMLPNTENSETEAHFMSDIGAIDVEVRIANPDSDDYSSANDSRTETFYFDPPSESPDLEITDLRVIGGWHEGDEVNLRAHIENNGTEGWNILGGLPYVEYFVRYEGSGWETVGGDTLTGGVINGFSEWLHTDFTLAQDGPFEVRVSVTGRDYETNTDNNVWTEIAGVNRDDVAQKTIENSASEVKLAAFLARAVYGAKDIPTDYRDTVTNGLNDDYKGYLGAMGLTVLTDDDFGDLFRSVDENSQFFDGGLYAGDEGLASSDPEKWQAQGLVAEGYDEDGKKTLTLTFRGTDEADFWEALVGQSWTGNGLFDYYESMRPLIEAALAYANDSANGIEKMLVTGHSLGGATADAFTLVDAHRLEDHVDLTVVAIASPGVDVNFLDDTLGGKGMLGQYDPTDVYNGLSVNPPPFYIGVSHRIDAVTYPFLNPLNPLEKVPNQTLLTNRNMDSKLTAILTPNIDNDDLPGYNFGAGHNAGLYWANLSQIMSDPLKELHAGHRITVGLSDYSQIEDMDSRTNENGDIVTFGVFTDYVNYGGSDDDTGSKALVGDNDTDFILGFSGNDQLRGLSGDDLLSGGAGHDLLEGGANDDVLDGGDGDDDLFGGSGKDDLRGGDGVDQLFGGTGEDVLHGGVKADSLGGGGDNDTLNGDDGADILWGNSGDDSLFGGNGNDDLSGGAGHDELDGGIGDDSLEGGAGRDVLNGADGMDDLRGNKGQDQLDGGDRDDILGGGTGNDLLRGNRGADDLFGGSGKDDLRGGLGKDTLKGGGGNDRLDGGDGDDVLGGGSGADMFVFSSGTDIITDFATGDRINMKFNAEIETFADLTENHLSQDDTTAVIDDLLGNVIRLENVDLITLVEADFIF